MPPSPLNVRDPSDNIVLWTALAAGSAYLVSGDGDLLALRGDERLGKLRIVTAREFIARLPAP